MRRPGPGLSLLLAAGLGAVAAFGQEPYGLAPLLVLAFALVIALYDPLAGKGRAALLGWAFGTGYFLHALQWIVSPFLVDVARHGWMAPFALVLMGLGMGLFWMLAFWGARLLTPGSRWPLVFTLAAAEMLRAHLFTGFPWAMPAQSLVASLPGQALAWIGPYGLNLAILLVSLLGALVLTAQGRAARLLAGLLAAAGLGLTFLPVPGGPSPLTEGVVRLVQPNAAQRDKWDPEKARAFYARQIEFSAAPPQGAQAPDLVLWSETAIPWLLHHAGPILPEIAEAGAPAPVALGVQRFGAEEGVYFNSLVVLDAAGAVAQLYDKHHLVPFGEYMPFGGLMRRIGLEALAAQVGSGFAAGPGPALLDFGALGRALPLICYEAVFARDARTELGRPDFIIQVTNDAWFGRGAGPRQHLAQARMRAIEQGLPLARAANTGISAMIDPQGRIIASLPLNSAGFLDAPLPAPLAPTPYARTGDFPLGLLLLFGLCTCAVAGRRE